MSALRRVCRSLAVALAAGFLALGTGSAAVAATPASHADLAAAANDGEGGASAAADAADGEGTGDMFEKAGVAAE